MGVTAGIWFSRGRMRFSRTMPRQKRGLGGVGLGDAAQADLADQSRSTFNPTRPSPDDLEPRPRSRLPLRPQRGGPAANRGRATEPLVAQRDLHLAEREPFAGRGAQRAAGRRDSSADGVEPRPVDRIEGFGGRRRGDPAADRRVVVEDVQRNLP